MDTADEARDYDSMDHSFVNRLFVDDLLAFIPEDRSKNNISESLRPSTREVESATAAHTVVDLGTGTALIPLELMSRDVQFSSIIACDLSVQMLLLASQHLRQSAHAQTVLPTFCDAKRLPLANHCCDILMSNSIVHHIPSPLDVFHEMRRVLHPDGLLFIRDLMRPANAERVEQFVSTYAGDENPHQQQMFRESLHAALTVDEVKSLLAKSGFNPEWVRATSDRHWTVAGRLSGGK